MTTIVPIFICVVLPVAIVLIIGLTKQNATNRKAEVMLKAIEAGTPIDPNMFKTQRPKSVKEDLVDKLTGACVTGFMGFGFLLLFVMEKLFPGFVPFSFSYLPFAGVMMLAVGIGLGISYFAGKKMLAKEIEAEDNAR